MINNNITTFDTIGNIDQQLPTASSSSSFNADSTINLPNQPKMTLWQADDDFVKFLTADKTVKTKSHQDILKSFVSFKSALLKDIDGWILSGALHSDFVQRGSLFQIFEKINDSMGPNNRLPRLGIEHPFLWSLYDILQPSTNVLRLNNRDTLTENLTAALRLHPVISQVDRKPLDTVQMDIQAQQIANELINIKDFAATQGRNSNDFYNGYTAIASSTTTKQQSVSLIYALIFAWGYAMTCAASIDEDNAGIGNYRLRLSDYEKHSLITAFNAANNDTVVNQPWFGAVNDDLYVRAQYTTIGWLLAANNNNIDYDSIPNGTPAKRYVQGTDSSGVCIIPFKKSVGIIPSIYMLAHLPWPIMGYKMNFEYTDCHGTTTDAQFMFNAFNTIIDRGSRRWEHDVINDRIYVDVLFVDVTDWNITMSDQYPLPFLNGAINVPSVYQAEIDIAQQVTAGMVNINQDYETSIMYATHMYPDTYSFLRGVKTLISLLTPRTNVAGTQRLTAAGYNSDTASGYLDTSSSASTRDYLFTHFLLDGSPTLISNVNRTAVSIKSGFNDQQALADVVDSSGVFRCLLASRHLYDVDWSSNYAGLQRFGLGLGSRMPSRMQAYGLSALSSILMSCSAIVGNALGLTKSSYANGIIRNANPHVGLYQNFVWRGLIDIPVEKSRNEMLFGGQIRYGWGARDWRMSPISTFGKSGMYYVGWQDASCESLYTRTAGKNRLPIYSSGAQQFFILSNASFKFDVTQNVWIGDEWISYVEIETTANSASQQIKSRPGLYCPTRYGGLMYSRNDGMVTYHEPVISIHSMTDTASDNAFATEVISGFADTDQRMYCYMPVVGFSTQSTWNEFPDRDIAIIAGSSNEMNVYQPFIRNTSPTFIDQPQLYSSYRMNYGIESVDCNF